MLDGSGRVPGSVVRRDEAPCHTIRFERNRSRACLRSERPRETCKGPICLAALVVERKGCDVSYWYWPGCPDCRVGGDKSLSKGSKVNAITRTRIEDDPQSLVHLLHCMFESRAGDEREGILLRQGKGWLQVSAAGHEALAGLALHLRPEDCLFPHYRDRALMLARGMSTEQLAKDYFACAGSSSEGRNLPSHVSCRRSNVFSIASPTGSQCLPAVGYAWGIRLLAEGTLACPGRHEQGGEPKTPIVLCALGDAATRQGEFYEAVCFALQERLPIVFVVEDNGYGISTPTERLVPLRLGVFGDDYVVRLNARDVAEVLRFGGQAISKAREGGGPTILWCELDRLSSHTSSDDHRTYRPAKEIESLAGSDPIPRLVESLVASGELTPSRWSALQAGDPRRRRDSLLCRGEGASTRPGGRIGSCLWQPDATGAPTVPAGRSSGC